jgi:hypothetical protein
MPEVGGERLREDQCCGAAVKDSVAVKKRCYGPSRWDEDRGKRIRGIPVLQSKTVMRCWTLVQRWDFGLFGITVRCEAPSAVELLELRVG